MAQGTFDIITPEWPAPAHVRAAVTTRRGGVSRGPYASWNLGADTGDDPRAVAENRQRLRETLGLPAEPWWLRQVHGAAVVEADPAAGPCEADGAVTQQPGVVCAVLTADCLPVVLCDRQGGRVGVAHAGWRGLAAGVLEAAVTQLGGRPSELMAWLGPAIGPEVYEVGEAVYAPFAHDAAQRATFRPSGRAGRYLADLYGLARQRLVGCGVSAVYGGGFCTYTDQARFYSYRRDGATGRMATVAWLKTAGGEHRHET